MSTLCDVLHAAESILEQATLASTTRRDEHDLESHRGYREVPGSEQRFPWLLHPTLSGE